MNMHTPQQIRQHDEAMERRQRLWSGKPKVALLAAAKVVDPLAKAQMQIRQLKLEKAALELDLSDARSRMLDMAEVICAINDAQLDEAQTLDAPPSQPTAPRRPVSEIILEVMRDFPGITWEEVKSVRRERRLTSARQHCMAALYEQRPDLSYPMIGRMFNRDHSTVVHAVHKIISARAKA